MKLKSLIWTLGMKPRQQVYGTRRVDLELAQEGVVSYEKWCHPKDYFTPFDQILIDQLREFIQPGDSVIDIGAHCGDFTLPLALAAGPQGAVFAWEPNPFVYAVLEKNSQLNRRKTNIIPHNAAVSDVNGPIEFHYSDPGYCNGGEFKKLSRWRHGHPFRLTVTGHRLNEWLVQKYPERLSKIRFIKVDTEGNDLSVLQSIEAIIRQQRPTIHAEMFKQLTIEQRQAFFDFFDRLGYECHMTERGHGVEPKIRFDKSDVMRWEHFDFIAIPNKRASYAHVA
jgi:FkbM family methyltransferase